MGTKNNPGKFDCYAKAHPDEPIFVLRANDPLAPALVRTWAHSYATNCGEEPTADQSAKILEAYQCARAMRQWREANSSA